MNYRKETRRGDRKAVKVALYGILLSLAMLLGYVETLIPISLGVPGVKLGLANLVSIVSLYIIGTGGTIAIALCRIVLLTGFAYGNMAMMMYSLAGGALSLALMIFCRKRDLFGQVGVSIIGGVGHNVGQILVAAAVVENTGVFYYLPFLLAAGTVAGAVIGLLGGIVTKRLESYL
ncbi:Gx transporter family protein [Clostridium transplantifaecale]|uniref:Gx transporter family protein n=1 Tax=Clostridium transplantifaecale TaxID=2479838 RepID=UPI000F630881|nr:Gx transporter family protein [Clostridium transplantifaecale]